MESSSLKPATEAFRLGAKICDLFNDALNLGDWPLRAGNYQDLCRKTQTARGMVFVENLNHLLLYCSRLLSWKLREFFTELL
jgi:hypothetical protein